MIKRPGGEVRGGNIYFDGKDINTMNKAELKSIRWNKIAIVFQNSLDVLNPLLTIEEQINEVIRKQF